MSNNPLQKIADLEAQVADMTAEKEELEMRPQAARQLDADGMASAIAEAIDARLVKTERHLREDFVVKFAALFEPIIERTTNRMSGLEKRLDEAEVDQDGVERRLRQHLRELGEKFDELNRAQDGRLVGFSKTLEIHHARNDDALRLLYQYLLAGKSLAAEISRAAASCQTFRHDYDETVAKAEGDRTTLVKRAEGELTAFAQNVRRRLQEAVEPALKVMEIRMRSQFWRQAERLGTLALGALIMFGLLWLASPNGSTVLEAARWRKWQEGFTQEQSDRLNKVLAEIDEENRIKEGASSR